MKKRKHHIYNFHYASLNTYRYLTLQNLTRTRFLQDAFQLDYIKMIYVSPVLNDFNNISLLGAFLIIKLLTGQFPYIAKCKTTITLQKKRIKLLYHLV